MYQGPWLPQLSCVQQMVCVSTQVAVDGTLVTIEDVLITAELGVTGIQVSSVQVDVMTSGDMEV